MSDPNDYYRQLQQLELEQGTARLRTLALEFAATLERLPRLKAELEAMAAPRPGIDFAELAVRVEPPLVQATDLMLELDLLPAALREAPELVEFGHAVAATATVRTIAGLEKRYHALVAETKQAQAAAAALARAEAERRAAEEEQRRVAEEKAVRARVESEARRKAAVPEMVRVPGGTFTMGGLKGRDDVGFNISASELPAHEVRVEAFELGKYPVTCAQFDIFCADTGFAKPIDPGWGRGIRPIVYVSWDDAQSYCAWLCKLTGQRFRLPSEAEWEYAARAGTNTVFPWGNSPDPSRANFGNTVGRTRPVDDCPQNPWGLYDMHGNVWEWVQDTWHDNYKGAPAHGGVWPGGGANRVLRGGSWSLGPEYCRSAHRRRYASDDRDNYIGFRLSRSLP